jgi:hypothetical protein
MKMNAIPDQTAQDIDTQQYQHKSNREFQSLRKSFGDQRIHHQYQTTKQKKG